MDFCILCWISGLVFSIILLGDTQMINNTGFRILITLVLFSSIYGYLSDDDYHKMLDGEHIVQYNCNMLIGGWHPDVPSKVIDECRKKNYETQSNKK